MKTYREVANYLEEKYGMIMQQRRKRYAVPTSQYQLLWYDKAGDARYVTLKVGLKPDQILQVAQRLMEASKP